MHWRLHRAAYITIAIAASLSILMAVLAPHTHDPHSGDAPWIPDPRVAATRDAAWLTAAIVALWLACVAVIEHSGLVPPRRWTYLGVVAGMVGGLALGTTVWWSERPRVLGPGEAGMVVRRDALAASLGQWPVDWIVGFAALETAGDPGVLFVAPVVAWGILGGAMGTVIMLGAAAIGRRQPNVALKLSGDRY